MKNRAIARRSPCPHSGELLVKREKRPTYLTSKKFCLRPVDSVSYSFAPNCAALLLPIRVRVAECGTWDAESGESHGCSGDQTSYCAGLTFGFAFQLPGESFDFFGFLGLTMRNYRRLRGALPAMRARAREYSEIVSGTTRLWTN